MQEKSGLSPFFYNLDPNLPARDAVYLAILHESLIHIRNQGNAAGTITAHHTDHLHNIPTYIAQGDHANHLYYLAVEVPLYLDRVRQSELEEPQLVRKLIPLWEKLESLVPIEGSRWQADWVAMKSCGWKYGLHD
ncbi:MAG: hypothetical protein AAF078_09130 [Planctomycetota bacterium]